MVCTKRNDLEIKSEQDSVDKHKWYWHMFYPILLKYLSLIL